MQIELYCTARTSTVDMDANTQSLYVLAVARARRGGCVGAVPRLHFTSLLRYDEILVTSVLIEGRASTRDE